MPGLDNKQWRVAALFATQGFVCPKALANLTAKQNFVSFFFSFFFLISCAQTDSDGPAIETSVHDISVRASSRGTLMKLADFLPSPVRAETSGQNRYSDLTSLKYFIRAIAVCESMTVTANTFSSPTNCINFYGRSDNPAYEFTVGTDYASIANVARPDNLNFVDLATAAGRSQLGTNFPLRRPHVAIYNYGYVSYYPAVKWTAKLLVNDSGSTRSYYTHDGVTSHIGSGNHVTESSVNFTNGVAEEATVLLPRGETWFKLHTPLTIVPSDIDQMKKFTIDFLFNSEGYVKAHSNAINLTGNYLLRDTNSAVTSNKLSFSGLEFTPVVRTLGETLIRESYLFDFSAVAGVSDRFNLRMDFFYVSEDETKAIRGIEAKVVYRVAGQVGAPLTTTEVPEFPRISSVTRNADATHNFHLPDGSTILQSFSRLTGVGLGSPATFNCVATWSPSSCSGTITVPYTLVGLSSF